MAPTAKPQYTPSSTTNGGGNVSGVSPRPTNPSPVRTDNFPRAVGGSIARPSDTTFSRPTTIGGSSADPKGPRFTPSQPLDASSGGIGGGGGSVRSNPNSPTRDPGKLWPRDVKDRNPSEPLATPSPRGIAAPRPVTSSSLADRYQPKPLPTGIARPQPLPNAPTIRPQPNNPPTTKKPILADRYQPTREANERPRPSTNASDVRSKPRPMAPIATEHLVGSRPGIGSRPAGATYGSGLPNYGTRPRSSQVFQSGCYSSWDPCRSWNSTNCWNSGLTFGIGFGCGSFSWGLSSWYPYYCQGAYYGSGWAYGYNNGYGYGNCYGNGYWGNCYSPCSYAPWYPRTSYVWPSYCYVPTYTYAQPDGTYYEQPGSSVVMLDNAAQQPVAEVGQEEIPQRARVAPRELTSEELAKKYAGLGDFYFHENRFADAADAYGRARTSLPVDPTIHFALADASFALGDYHFAAFLIGEAVRLDPSMANVDTDKRLLYGDVTRFEAQMQTLQNYCNEKPYDAMAQLVLGYNLKLTLQPAAAERAFRRVLEIDPQSEAARLFLGALAATQQAPPQMPVRISGSTVEIK